MSNPSLKVTAGLQAGAEGRLSWDIISSLRTTGGFSLATLDVGNEPRKAIGVDDSPEIEYVDKQSTLIVHLWGESLPPCKSQKIGSSGVLTNRGKYSTKQVPLWVLWVLTCSLVAFRLAGAKIGSSGVLTMCLTGYNILIYLVFLMQTIMSYRVKSSNHEYIAKKLW